jgi:hypothetical protein
MHAFGLTVAVALAKQIPYLNQVKIPVTLANETEKHD